jgi:hypothetical protein
MKSERDPDEILMAWLDENMVPLPVSTRRAIDVGTRTVTQRQPPRWWPRRMEVLSDLMSTPSTRGLAAAAAVVVVAVGAVVLLGSRGGVGPGVSPPSPTPVVTASPSATVLDVLEPGVHTTNFDPKLTFTIPAGWSMLENTSESVILAPTAFSSATVLVCKDPAAANQAAEPVAGIGESAKDLTDFLASREELGLMGQPTVYRLGGLEGYWMDLQGPADITEVNVIGSTGTCGIQMYKDQRIRLAFLDAPDATVMILIWDTLGSEVFIEAGSDIVETFVFDVP